MTFPFNGSKPAEQLVEIVIKVGPTNNGAPGNSSVKIGNGDAISIGNIHAPTQDEVNTAAQQYSDKLDKANKDPTVLSLNGVKTALTTTLKPLCIKYNGDKTNLDAINAANTVVITAIDKATDLKDDAEFKALTSELTIAITNAGSVKKQYINTSDTTAAIKGFGAKIDKLVVKIDLKIAAARIAAANPPAGPSPATGASEKATENQGDDNNATPAATADVSNVVVTKENTAKELAGKNTEAVKKEEDTDIYIDAVENTETENASVNSVATGAQTGGSRPKNTRKRRRNKRNRKTAYRRRY